MTTWLVSAGLSWPRGQPSGQNGTNAIPRLRHSARRGAPRRSARWNRFCTQTISVPATACRDADLLRYAAQLGLDLTAFERDRASRTVLERIQRDVDSGLASGQVLGTPTLFIDGVVHRRGYDPPTLLAALAP